MKLECKVVNNVYSYLLPVTVKIQIIFFENWRPDTI